MRVVGRYFALLLLSLAAFPSTTNALDFGFVQRFCIPDAGPLPPLNVEPIPIGCEIVDCCPGCPGAGPIEWRVNIDSKMLAGAELRFERVGQDALKQLKLTGGATLADDRVNLPRGASRISGLPRRTADVAVGLLQPMLGKESAATLSGAQGRELTERITIQQFVGPYLVSSYTLGFRFKPCPKPPAPPKPTEDKLKIQGLAEGEEVVVMLDARQVASDCNDGRPGKNQWVFSAGAETGLGNLLAPAGCNSEIAVFSKNHAVHWDPAVTTWTDSPGNVHTVTLQPLLETNLHIWVKDGLSTTRMQQIENAAVKARDLYLENRTGVRFNYQITRLTAATYGADAYNVVRAGIDPTYYDCVPLTTTGTPQGIDLLKTKPYYTANTLNVYYIEDAAFTWGKSCSIRPVPGSCPTSAAGLPAGDRNIIYVGSGAGVTTLAHEIGHAYGLRPARCGGHTDDLSVVADFTLNNLMWAGGGVERTELKLGQVYRMHTHDDFWGGTVLIPNEPSLATSRVPRGCIPKDNTALCPALKVDWP